MLNLNETQITSDKWSMRCMRCMMRHPVIFNTQGKLSVHTTEVDQCYTIMGKALYRGLL